MKRCWFEDEISKFRGEMMSVRPEEIKGVVPPKEENFESCAVVCGHGLKIYTSSRIEALAEKLVAELKSERAEKGRFEFLKVAVANPNLGNWLKMKVLAKVPELSAGIEMPFLDERLAELLKGMLPEGAEFEVVSGRKYPVEILAEILSSHDDAYRPLWNYIVDGQVTETPPQIYSMRASRKAVQLTHKLGELIDAYEAMGHLETLAEFKDKNAVYAAEQKLAEALFGTGERAWRLSGTRGSLRQLFELVKAGFAVKPPSSRTHSADEKIVLFGHTQLSPLQSRILAWLAKTQEVVLYYPGVVAETANVRPESWHVAARKTINCLKRCLAAEGVALTIHPVACAGGPAPKVLPAVQDVLLGGTCAEKLPQDASVQIIGAPGLRREVEMVYNAVLGAVWEKNEGGKPEPRAGLSFSDIAVLVSDMKTYRPLIERVFDGRGQIPYGLVDVTTQDYSSYLDGFLALMELARYGLSRPRVFTVLENPCVQRAMKFSREDVTRWNALVAKYGAFDGFKEKDSDERNASGHFNWDWALRRMRLGLVANELDDKLPIEADDAEDVCRLSEVVETLYRRLDNLNHLEPTACSSDDPTLWPDTWAGRLHAVMDEFLAVEKSDDLEASVRARIVHTLNGLTAIAGEWSSYRLPVAMVEQTVAGTECAKGGYLRHGVTIGGLRSLMHVPFKQIFVLGLGEGGLPGSIDRSTLDVRNELKPEDRTDMLGPEDNRGRFLAAVLAARERLVLSYPNCKLDGDAKLYPSSFVNELKDVLSKDVQTAEFKEFKGYPLVEWVPAINMTEGKIESCLSGEAAADCFKGLLPTYSEQAYILAAQPSDRAARNAVAAKESERAKPTPKELADFVKDSFTAILRQRLGISAEGYRSPHLDEVSPLDVQKGPTLWNLQEEMLKDNFEAAFAQGQRQSNTPCEFLGEFAKQKLADKVAWARNAVTAEERYLIGADAPRSATLAVVCRGYDVGTKKAPITLPPDAVLEPLFTRLADCAEGGGAEMDFTVKVVNVDKQNRDAWHWSLPAADARKYYEGVAALYERWLAEADDPADSSAWSPNVDGRYPSFTFKELRAVLKQAAAIPADRTGWDAVAKDLLDKRTDYTFAGSNFDSNPVISKVAEPFEREPTGEDLLNLYEELFKLPLQGVKVGDGAGNGGAR